MNNKRGLPRAQSRGFTLIELLIVIGIIIIIASLVIVSVSKARARGRDGKRIADLSTIQLALEMYRDKNQKYPATTTPGGEAWITSGGTCGGTCIGTVKNWDGLQTSLKDYLFPLPKDPLKGKTFKFEDNTTGTYGYEYGATESNYKLKVRLEDDTSSMENDGGVYPTSTVCPVTGATTSRKLYEIFTLGAQGWTVCDSSIMRP